MVSQEDQIHSEICCLWIKDDLSVQWALTRDRFLLSSLCKERKKYTPRLNVAASEFEDMRGHRGDWVFVFSFFDIPLGKVQPAGVTFDLVNPELTCLQHVKLDGLLLDLGRRVVHPPTLGSSIPLVLGSSIFLTEAG